jgi:ubiquinone/menaquinone biosynthesis C-methylase UbiE
MTLTLHHPDAEVRAVQLSSSRWRVTVELHDSAIFSPRLECETGYPPSLVELILQVKGPAWLCDEIARDEDPAYVLKHLETEMRAYFDLDEFEGKRILDFGCGSGASTMLLARLFPKSEIVGVELEPNLLQVARGRQEHYRYDNLEFKQSPSGTEMPVDLGRFDLIVLSAVYEHLFPNERPILMSKFWSMLNDGGILFLDQTPNRYFPIELHTTSLPLINYLPDRLTLMIARRFSRRVNRTDSWQALLRAGIRGATVGEITSQLGRAGTKAELLRPTQTGLQDRVDLWFETTNPNNLRALKKVAKSVLKSLNAATGIAIIPELTLAYRKSRKT